MQLVKEWLSECCDAYPVRGLDIDNLGMCSNCHDKAVFYLNTEDDDSEE